MLFKVVDYSIYVLIIDVIFIMILKYSPKKIIKKKKKIKNRLLFI